MEGTLDFFDAEQPDGEGCSAGGWLRALRKTYARTFEPAMSHAEYLASVIAEQLPAKQLPELIAALMQKVETTPAIQKEMRAALRENAQ